MIVPTYSYLELVTFLLQEGYKVDSKIQKKEGEYGDDGDDYANMFARMGENNPYRVEYSFFTKGDRKIDVSMPLELSPVDAVLLAPSSIYLSTKSANARS